MDKKYKLLEKIGEGSFGVVYRAYNLEEEKEIAIKIEKKRKEKSLL